MPNFLLQDIYKERTLLEFPNSDYSSNLVAFKNCLAPPASDDKLKETTLFQVIDVRDTSKSLMSEIEELNMIVDINKSFYDNQRVRNGTNNGNGKTPKRKTINEIDDQEMDDEGFNDGTQYIKKRVFRLTLEDCFGNVCYAYEEEPLHFLRKTNALYPIKLGYKLLVNKGSKIIFNTLFIKNADIKPLGGEIDKLNYKLHERKLKDLKNELAYEK